MSTTTSREAELVELAREFIARAALHLAEAVDWALGDDFRGKLRRIVAEHDKGERRRVEAVEDKLASLGRVADALETDGYPVAARECRAEADNLRAEAGLS